MEAIRKENPIAVDFKIDQIQESLEKHFQRINIDGIIYPKCYILEGEQGDTIEHYTGNNEYSGNIVTSEGNKIFFLADNIREQVNNIQFRTKINLFGIVNLFNIDNNSAERNDERFISEVTNVVKSFRNSNIKVFTNFNEIYGSSMPKNLLVQNDNIQPYFYFRIDFDVIYDLEQNC